MPMLHPGKITIATYAAFAPVCASDEQGVHGRDVDFLRAFAQQQGLTIEFRVFLFDRIWERPGRGEVDIAAAGIAPLCERQCPGVVWSESYFTVERSLLIRATDQIRFKTIHDFAGYTIAVTRGSTADIDTQQRKPATAHLVYYDKQERAVAELLSGKIDAFGTGDVCSHYLVDQHPKQLAVADVHPMAEPEQFAFAVRAESDLLPALNAFIRENRLRY
ncbi:MAG: ABC transporter substrate-binding protein [Caldilineaceae bacterium]